MTNSFVSYFMLSYQHGFHAGNFADVFKHCALTHLIQYLIQKDKPLFYLETHSGRGLYDLSSHQSLKTNEFKEGIQLLWEQQKKCNAVFLPYLKLLKELNLNSALKYYPGSPYIALNLLRPTDRAHLCELHPTEYEHLIHIPTTHKKVFFSPDDGPSSLNALLPPIEKRGLIFIDPAYEVKEEYKTIPQAISKAVSKFANGVYCLWYPLVNQRMTEQMIRRLEQIPAKNTLRVEFYLKKQMGQGMYGCGLWLINPPYTFADTITTVCKELKLLFNSSESFYHMDKRGQ